MATGDQEWQADTPGDFRPFSGEIVFEPDGRDRGYVELHPRLAATVLYQIQVERGAVDVVLVTERGFEELESNGSLPSVAVWEDSSVRGVTDAEQVYGAVPPGDYRLVMFDREPGTGSRCELEGKLTAGWRA